MADIKREVTEFLKQRLREPSTYCAIAILALVCGTIWPESIETWQDAFLALKTNLSLFVAVAAGIVGILLAEEKF